MERIVFVHGSVGNGDASWSNQQTLADRYELLVLNRPGFPPGPVVERIDFEEHARWVAGQLHAGDHLVGHSYGGVVSLYAAAVAPGLASLTVIEPPAFGIALQDAAVEAWLPSIQHIWADPPSTPRDFLAAFYTAVAGRPVALPDPLPPALEQGARALMVERGPWEARPPLDALAAAPYPKLVVSGGWSRAFDAVLDVLEARLDARRAVLPGMGHSPHQLGEPFNEVLRAFLHDATVGAG